MTMPEDNDIPDVDDVRTVTTDKVACDGNGGPLGHPMIYLNFRPDQREIVCPYCSRRFRRAEGVEADAGRH